MIEVYRKTGTIKAEQFDGSDEMIDKYHIEAVEGDYAEDYSMPEGGPAPYVRYFLTRFDLAKGISVGDWIVTGINGEHWTIADGVFKKTYAEMPVIPAVIAEYISAVKNGETDLENITVVEAALGAIEYDQASHIEAEWIQQHGDEFARAWLDGYQVEAQHDTRAD